MVTPVGRNQFDLAAPTVCLLSSIAIGAGAAMLVTVVGRRAIASSTAIGAANPAPSAPPSHP